MTATDTEHLAHDVKKTAQDPEPVFSELAPALAPSQLDRVEMGLTIVGQKLDAILSTMAAIEQAVAPALGAISKSPMLAAMGIKF